MEVKLVKTKRLIINADDYGLNDNVNEAIISLIKSNIVSSTTVLANIASDTSILKLVRLSKDHFFSIGLHINLVEGKPVCNANVIPSITNRNGNFLSPGLLLLKSIFNLINENEVKKEINAQFHRLRESGCVITHVDSHMHTHVFPRLSNIFLDEIKMNGIHAVRYTKPSHVGNYRMWILTIFTYISNRGFQTFNHVERLITIFTKKNISAINIFKYIKNNTDELFEMMVHPSMVASANVYDGFYEYNVLNSDCFKAELVSSQIELISYSDI